MDRIRKATGLSRRAAYLRGKLLERRRLLLENMLSGFEASVESSEEVSSDLADMADAAMARELSCQIGSVESDVVDRIDRAIERIDSGTYGRCEGCGKRISEARLRILPFADLCVSCQANDEREGLRHVGEELGWKELEALIGSEGTEGGGENGEPASVVRGRRHA